MLSFKRCSLTQGEKTPIFKCPHFLSMRSEKKCPPTCNNITVYKNNQTTKKEMEHVCGIIQRSAALSFMTQKAKIKVKIKCTVIKI